MSHQVPRDSAVRIEERILPCPECSGTGFRPGFDQQGKRVSEPCLRCDGRGHIGKVTATS